MSFYPCLVLELVGNFYCHCLIPSYSTNYINFNAQSKKKSYKKTEKIIS